MQILPRWSQNGGGGGGGGEQVIQLERDFMYLAPKAAVLGGGAATSGTTSIATMGGAEAPVPQENIHRPPQQGNKS